MQKIDDKHYIGGDKLFKTNNVEIDLSIEPVILFRGRDNLAVPMLEFYYQLCKNDGCNDHQLDGLKNRINLFKEFAKTSPTMKQPGITRGL